MSLASRVLPPTRRSIRCRRDHRGQVRARPGRLQRGSARRRHLSSRRPSRPRRRGSMRAVWPVAAALTGACYAALVYVARVQRQGVTSARYALARTAGALPPRLSPGVTGRGDGTTVGGRITLGIDPARARPRRRGPRPRAGQRHQRQDHHSLVRSSPRWRRSAPSSATRGGANLPTGLTAALARDRTRPARGARGRRAVPAARDRRRPPARRGTAQPQPRPARPLRRGTTARRDLARRADRARCAGRRSPTATTRWSPGRAAVARTDRLGRRRAALARRHLGVPGVRRRDRRDRGRTGGATAACAGRCRDWRADGNTSSTRTGSATTSRSAIPGVVNVGNAALAAATAALWGVAAADALRRDGDDRTRRRALSHDDVRRIAGAPAAREEPGRLDRGADDGAGGHGSQVVVAVNARAADGRDPSWLWDVPFELLRAGTRSRPASGPATSPYGCATPAWTTCGSTTPRDALAQRRPARPGRGARQLHRVPDLPAGGPRCWTRVTRSAVRIALVYPAVLGTYGDGGNAVVLAAAAALARHRRRDWSSVEIDQPLPEQADIYVLGGGEDSAQTLAVSRLADGVAAPGVRRAARRCSRCAPASRSSARPSSTDAARSTPGSA